MLRTYDGKWVFSVEKKNYLWLLSIICNALNKLLLTRTQISELPSHLIAISTAFFIMQRRQTDRETNGQNGLFTLIGKGNANAPKNVIFKWQKDDIIHTKIVQTQVIEQNVIFL